VRLLTIIKIKIIKDNFTVLQRDLKPELERMGVVVVYVDMWSDKKRDPALLITQAIGEVLGQHMGAVAKLAAKSGGCVWGYRQEENAWINNLRNWSSITG
jgi:hypothetical protein